MVFNLFKLFKERHDPLIVGDGFFLVALLQAGDKVMDLFGFGTVLLVEGYGVEFVLQLAELPLHVLDDIITV